MGGSSKSKFLTKGAKSYGPSITPTAYDKKDKRVNFSVNIEKKVLDGKDIMSYSLNYYKPEGKDVRKEYTDKDKFVKECLYPAIDSMAKEIG